MRIEGEDILQFSVGRTMPISLHGMAPDAMGASLCAFSKGEISAFMYLDDPTCEEIKAFNESFTLSLFICENIPFFIFIFKGFCLEAVVTDKTIIEEPDVLLMRMVDAKTQTIVAQRSIRTPKSMMRIAYNALSSSYLDREEVKKTVRRIRATWSVEKMVYNGIALKFNHAGGSK